MGVRLSQSTDFERYAGIRKKKNLVQAVIFDFDGTMADFEETDTECLKLILRKTGAEANTDSFVAMAVEHIIHFHGLVDSDEIDPLTLHQYRLSKTFRDFGILWDDSYVDTYKDLLLERTLPYQGIEEILNRTF